MERVHCHNLQIVYKWETVSFHLNRELESTAASLLSVFVNNTVRDNRRLEGILQKKRINDNSEGLDYVNVKWNFTVTVSEIDLPRGENVTQYIITTC